MAAQRNATMDQMIGFAMEALLSGDDWRRRTIVRSMAQRWPAEPALALVYAVTSAAEAIEDAFGEVGDRDPVVPSGYRLSALISADVPAIQSMGQIPPVAEDLLHFWRRGGQLFMRLR